MIGLRKLSLWLMVLSEERPRNLVGHGKLQSLSRVS